MAKAELRAEIDLNTTKFQRGIAKTQKSIGSMVSSGVRRFGALAAAFAGVGLVKKMVSLGLSAEETADKFNSVFGPAADDMNKRVEKLKETIPATTKELQDAVAVFGLMAQSFGLNAKAAEDFSINMATIAGDLASFHDIAPEVAFDKLRAGIAGSSEPLQALGIDIREAALKQEALNLGIWDGVGVLSTSQKAMAVQAAVVNQMGAASGNAALTINSAANQVKFLTRDLKEAGTTIGTFVMPLIKDFASGVRLIGEGIGKLKGPDVVKGVAMDFEKMAKDALIIAGELESTAGSFDATAGAYGSIVEDSEAVARNQKKIAERAADLEASWNAVDEETKKVILNTDDISDNQKEINKANDALKQSILDQIKAQGEFQAQQKIIKKEAEEKSANEARVAALKLQMMNAEIAGEKTLLVELQKQLETEMAIQKTMKAVNVDRAEATKLVMAQAQAAAAFAEQEERAAGAAAGIKSAADFAARRMAQMVGTSKKIGMALGIDSDVKGKTTEELELDLAFRSKQSKEVGNEIRLTGHGNLAMKLEQAYVQAQISALEGELGLRSNFAKISGFGSGQLFSSGFYPSEIIRLAEANGSDFTTLTNDRNQAFQDNQTRLLESVSDSLVGIRGTTSRLDEGLQS